MGFLFFIASIDFLRLISKLESNWIPWYLKWAYFDTISYMTKLGSKLIIRSSSLQASANNCINSSEPFPRRTLYSSGISIRSLNVSLSWVDAASGYLLTSALSIYSRNSSFKSLGTPKGLSIASSLSRFLDSGTW